MLPAIHPHGVSSINYQEFLYGEYLLPLSHRRVEGSFQWKDSKEPEALKALPYQYDSTTNFVRCHRTASYDRSTACGDFIVLLSQFYDRTIACGLSYFCLRSVR